MKVFCIKSIWYFQSLFCSLFSLTVKAFVVTPKMTKNSIIFKGVTTKAIKFSIADENLFVCILNYFNKTYIFSGLLKNVRIIK